ncbi:hypothetical protein [Vreelandella neptunia]|uniref:Uncharacterized protein n=1 Tax=Vreelandella neptunia TaxID=115551 RepID=A0ABZ0YK35_9GAMM|nr:hypothetical protein [Halomonas neptunia]MDN3561244.1 hypothetical protein [Halomonas neptunia]WQH12479.1 hypothetical protein SR894_20410 [Halomonas neptunia]
MTPQDQTYLLKAALTGDVRQMDQASKILAGVAMLLNDHDLDGLKREALIETLWLLSSTFEERRDWLQEEGYVCSEQ